MAITRSIFKLDPYTKIPTDDNGRPLKSITKALPKNDSWMKGLFLIESILRDAEKLKSWKHYDAGMQFGIATEWKQVTKEQAQTAIDILTLARSYIEELTEKSDEAKETA